MPSDLHSNLPAEADKIISMTQEIVIRLSGFKMHLANYFIVTMAARVPSPDGSLISFN